VVDEVFTNSAEYGIISQRDFFDKDIANTENIDGYYVVEPNDFVYNPRISTTAPFGPIKRNKLERSGAMSPLYYVFRPNNVDLSYLEWFFQTSCWYPFMRFNGNSGARSDRFAITDKIFNEMPISLPQDIEEQKRIGMFLTTLDTLITLHQRKQERI
jgi:type I restriction enzyme S subunit